MVSFNNNQDNQTRIDNFAYDDYVYVIRHKNVPYLAGNMQPHIKTHNLLQVGNRRKQCCAALREQCCTLFTECSTTLFTGSTTTLYCTL